VLGVVAYIYNTSYLGGRDHEDHSCSPAWAKKLVRPLSQQIRWLCAGGARL
jgi:hypothetical protein